jgi:hypothetical protein
VADDLQLRALPRFEAYMLHTRASRGDAEARDTFRALWPPDAPCFLCDEPVAAWATTLLLPDPDDPANRALLAPECAKCAKMTGRRHDRRVREMITALWPSRRTLR